MLSGRKWAACNIRWKERCEINVRNKSLGDSLCKEQPQVSKPHFPLENEPQFLSLPAPRRGVSSFLSSAWAWRTFLRSDEEVGSPRAFPQKGCMLCWCFHFGWLTTNSTEWSAQIKLDMRSFLSASGKFWVRHRAGDDSYPDREWACNGPAGACLK